MYKYKLYKYEYSGYFIMHDNMPKYMIGSYEYTGVLCLTKDRTFQNGLGKSYTDNLERIFKKGKIKITNKNCNIIKYHDQTVILENNKHVGFSLDTGEYIYVPNYDSFKKLSEVIIEIDND